MITEEFHSSHSLTTKLEELVETNLNNEQFGVEELSDAIGLSRSQLHRKLKKITGQSISQFIREFRLKKAHELLLQEDLTAAEVAYKVGFSSPTYFSKAFHDYFGYTPGEVKKQFTSTKEEIPKQPSHINYKLIGRVGVLVTVLLAFLLFVYQNVSKPSIADKSIVVLPFVNMSNNPEQQFFSDGVMDAVLNHLSKFEEMRVISRTTAMRYKNTDKSIPEIAKELNVKYVLEGGVQESNGQIRINARLIEASSEDHIWSEQYDRKLENIFSIQTDIAKSIAFELSAHISPEKSSVTEISTDDPEAYENYLHGKYLLQGNWSLDKIEESRRYFKAAIAQDSLFTEAYIWLANTFYLQGTWYGNLYNREAAVLGDSILDKAINIDPDHPYLLWVLASNIYLFDWDFLKADSLFNKAKKVGLRYGTLDFHLDLMLRRFFKVIDESKRKIEEDPFEGTMYWNLAYAYYHTDQADKALAIINKGFEVDPYQESYFDHFGNLYNAMGYYEKALETFSEGLDVSAKRHASMVAHLAITYHHLNNPEFRDRLISELRDRIAAGEPEIKNYLGHAYAGINKPDSAFYWLNEAYKDHEVEMIWLQADPNLLLLKGDPRYQVLLDQVGFPKATQP